MTPVFLPPPTVPAARGFCTVSTAATVFDTSKSPIAAASSSSMSLSSSRLFGFSPPKNSCCGAPPGLYGLSERLGRSPRVVGPRLGPPGRGPPGRGGPLPGCGAAP